jgi:hypothetical protein
MRVKISKEKRRFLFKIFAPLVPLLFKILAVPFGKEFSQQRSKEKTWRTENHRPAGPGSRSVQFGIRWPHRQVPAA